MKKTLAAFAMLLPLLCTSAFTTAVAANTQQTKMASCNKDATGKKGDERKAFMKQCLSAKSEAAAAPTQQDKMKTCAASGKGKKGDDYKSFMKQCLSS